MQIRFQGTIVPHPDNTGLLSDEIQEAKADPNITVTEWSMPLLQGNGQQGHTMDWVAFSFDKRKAEANFFTKLLTETPLDSLLQLHRSTTNATEVLAMKERAGSKELEKFLANLSSRFFEPYSTSIKDWAEQVTLKSDE